MLTDLRETEHFLPSDPQAPDALEPVVAISDLGITAVLFTVKVVEKWRHAIHINTYQYMLIHAIIQYYTCCMMLYHATNLTDLTRPAATCGTYVRHLQVSGC